MGIAKYFITVAVILIGSLFYAYSCVVCADVPVTIVFNRPEHQVIISPEDVPLPVSPMVD